MLQSPFDTERTKISTRLLAGRAFLVKTPPCSFYLKALTNWLITGSHGALVYGRPRLGKTSATRWVLRVLPELVGNVPNLEVPVRGQNIASERAFFQHLLRCARHRHAMTGTAGDKRDRLTEWLMARAIRSPVNTAVIFFDEAQLLQDCQYDWLLNMGNELDKAGCRLFCLLVGQSELAQTKAKFIDGGKEQIVGRFMVRELEFSGIRSEQELASCFKEFNYTIYPMETGTSFAANFIPKAIQSGFCLQELAPAFWSVFQEKWLSTGLGHDAAIPMHYINASLIGLLNSLVSHDRSELTVSHDLIAKSISASGYIESLQALKAGQQRRLNG
ncbi:uncharacterized protein NMK_2359 [Novimethylophilus kurashikiensis]|uniref:ORC1/DEAH AAA+ ATPase domain-containing protein n=1 Tax=Novimethylophilus kurashikiensis TaxID=1825523 RepID=A0A2R5FB34_9PROT|nr:ATP-binding protein [Novimethylophilus kurashikiensis]GBG14758.1 uncharacterized protein NMK_2359 [Novimethylophilus kurashikiensis]